MDIYFFNYNNYFLRKVKIKNDLNGFIHRSLNVNFNENDGVNASVVIGSNGNPYEAKSLPDYAIVVAESNEIVSRWFVLECIKNRKNQYTCKLRRDLLADFNDKILESVSYIEKGHTGEFSLNCIPEEVRFNQIKKGEYLLKNNIGVPWVVCYLPRYDGSGQRLSFSGTAEIVASADYLKSLYPYSAYIGEEYFHGEINEISISYREIYFDGSSTYKKMILSSGGVSYTILQDRPASPYFEAYLPNPSYELLNFAEAEEAWNRIYSLYNENPSLYINRAISKEKAAELKKQEGKVLEVTASGNLEQVHVSTETVYSSEAEISSNSNGGKKIAEVLNDISSGFPNPEFYPESGAVYNIFITTRGEEIELSLTTIPRSTSVEYNINYDTVEELNTTDAPYEIVAFPYGEAYVTTPWDNNNVKTNKNISLAVAQALMKGNAITDSEGNTTISNKAYDAQILPYIQYDDIINGSLYVPSDNLIIEIKENSVLVGWGLKLTQSTFSKIIQNRDIPIRADVKKSVVLDKYRLVSPNGVGEYEFSFAKNRGNKGFEADITLSPINPYIKINPIFGGLYGTDFNDFRGLICAGDFSIPYVTNSWIDYQLQNKNFAANFKNQLKSNDVTYKAAVAQRVSATVTSLAQGAMAGTVGIDDLASSGIALGGTVISEVISAATYKTQRDISIQNFTAAMESVQALPETLGKTTPFNNNNKYFPYIEHYTCSERAELLFDNQLKYGGQTLKIIGKIKDYYNAGKSYIKAYVIDSEIEEDSHVLEAINAELAQGVRYEF